MKWLKNLFGEPYVEDPGPSEIAIRVAEIQARIAAFKSSYSWSEAPNKNTKTQPEPLVATEQPKINTKSEEMDSLKAKLLGKKQ